MRHQLELLPFPLEPLPQPPPDLPPHQDPPLCSMTSSRLMSSLVSGLPEVLRLAPLPALSPLPRSAGLVSSSASAFAEPTLPLRLQLPLVSPFPRPQLLPSPLPHEPLLPL